jgi:uncharacterized protein YndB with AHSA1/START domain
MNETTTGETATASVRIERSFDAPVELLWEMWTDPTHFAAWYGPAGATVHVADMDLRIGGTRRICMEMLTPNGPMQMWFTGSYTDIDAPHRLAYTESMCDPDGNVISAAAMGLPDGHPDTTHVTVELAGDEHGRTRMVMTHVGIPAGSPGETGWAIAFDKLAAHLAGPS